MSEITIYIFKGAEVRTVADADGEPWFVAKDVADILGYGSAKDLCRRLDADEKGGRKMPTPGGEQELTIINESGLYSAILGSTKPEAKTFKKWVTSEVLPAIRRQGGYIAAAPEETPEQLYLRAMTVLKATVDRQQRQIEAQTEQLRLQAPAVEYAETVLASSSLMTVNTIAAHLGVSAKALNAFLCGEDWIYRQGAIWYPTAKIRDKGFCDYETVTYVNRAGDQCTRAHLKWTEQGRRAVIDLWNRRHTAGASK